MNTKTDTENQSMDTDLHALFLDELADLHNAEQQIFKALPKLIKAAESDELRGALQSHLGETEGHVRRLEEVFASLDETLKSKTCAALKGILEEGDELVGKQKGKSSLDAAIIAAAQKVEHYEIAAYGTVLAWAEQMGHDEAADLLQETLDEEAAADEKLSDIANEQANEKANREA